MTGEQFKAIRTKLGLSQKAMAERLQMGAHGWQTISGWENGKQPVPGPVSVAMAGIAKRSHLPT